MFTKQDTVEQTYAFLHKSLRPDETILWSGRGYRLTIYLVEVFSALLGMVYSGSSVYSFHF